MISTQLKLDTIGDSYEDEGAMKSELVSKTQQKTKFYETIYFKIVFIYLVYLLVCCAKFIYVKIIFDQFID